MLLPSIHLCCSDVAVPVTLTYLPDASAILSSAASRAAGAAPLPADFTVVSGALMVQAAGLNTGALPCDGCVARLTIPLSEPASPLYSYVCAYATDGQLYTDTAVVASSGGARSTAADDGSVAECSVNSAGTYLIGRVLKPAAAGDPAQGMPVQGGASGADAAQQGTGKGVPAIVGGVVGGVMGAVLVAAVALYVIKRR